MGWTVVAVDIGHDDARLPYPLGTPQQLQEVVAGGRDTPGTIIAALADVTDHDAMQAIVDTDHGRPRRPRRVRRRRRRDRRRRPQWELDPGAEQAVIDVCLGAVLTASRTAIPALLERPQPRHGRFLAVSSTAALRGLPMLAAYCAAKAGVAGLIRALATELRGTGVTANAVCPGSTRTRILDESARLYDLSGRTRSRPSSRSSG